MVSHALERPKLTAKGERARARIVAASAHLIHQRGEIGTDAADPQMQTAVLLRHTGLRLQGLEREAGLQPGQACRNGAVPTSAAGRRWLQSRHVIANPERSWHRARNTPPHGSGQNRI
jgi:hypothetical protein